MHPFIEVSLHLKQVGLGHQVILSPMSRASVLSEVIQLIRSNASEGGNRQSIPRNPRPMLSTLLFAMESLRMSFTFYD